MASPFPRSAANCPFIPIFSTSGRSSLFSGAASVFENKGKSEQRQHEKKVAELEKRLRDKDSVIAELLEEYTALKKTSGVR